MIGPAPGSVATTTVGAGMPLVRAHPHTFGSSEFDARDGANARWSTIRLGGSVVPVIYAGEDDRTAASETIFRLGPGGRRPPVVFAAQYSSWQWSSVVSRRDLVLADLRDDELARLGTPRARLLDGGEDTYPDTRAWAEHLLGERDDLDGMVWHTRQAAGRCAYVLFGAPRGRVNRSELAAYGRSVPFTSPDGMVRLRQIGLDYHVTVRES